MSCEHVIQIQCKGCQAAFTKFEIVVLEEATSISLNAVCETCDAPVSTRIHLPDLIARMGASQHTN